MVMMVFENSSLEIKNVRISRPAVSVQGTGPNKILVLRVVENNNEQSGASMSSEMTPQYSNKNEQWVPNGSKPAESVTGPRKILIRRAAERRAEQLEKQQKLSQYEVCPTNTSNEIAQFLENGTSSESTQNRRQIVIRRVVKRKAEQSEKALTSSEGSSYATSSASETRTFQNDPKQVVVRKDVRRNAEQSSTSSATSSRNSGIPYSTSSATTSSKPKSSGGSEIPSSSFSTSSDPVWTSSEGQNSEFSPGTSSETQYEQLSIPEILSQWNVKIEPEEEQKPERFRPPEEYPSFKILEEIRKSGESDSSELRFNYTEADLKADDFVIKIEPEEELKSEPIWDEQWDSEVKEEVNDDRFPTTSSGIRDEQCPSEVGKEINDEQCPMAPTSSEIRDDQSSSATEPNISPETTKCPICNQPKSIIDLVPLVGKYEKLVVLIPWVIDGFPIEEAITLLNSEEFDFVCLEHPISTVTKIFEFLNVSSIEQLEKIQIGPNHALSKIAQSISSIFSIGLKRTIFKFCEKFESQESYNQFVMEELERREIEGFRDQTRCVVCRKEEAKDLRKLGDSEEKLIFLSAFLDKNTVETARSIYKSNGAFRACDSHFEDIFKRIFEILPVSRIIDMKQCSIEESHPWMSDVRKLRSDITSNQYLDLLHGFCVRNRAEDKIQRTTEMIQMSNSEKCVICQKVKIRPLFRKTQTFIERLIVLTGWILTDKTAEIRAMSLLNEQISFVCWSHFSEFSGRILNELCIKNRNELSTCYQFLVKKLMKTVNILSPYMKKDEFLEEFELWLKAASSWCKPYTNVQFDKQMICSFCNKKKEEPIKRVESREDKLILMIASVLDKRFEMDIAIYFVRSQKELFICFQHFQSAIDRIFLFLSIQKMYQLSMCRQDLMQNLMVIVHNLNGEVRITTNEFRQIMRFQTWRKTNGINRRLQNIRTNLDRLLVIFMKITVEDCYVLDKLKSETCNWTSTENLLKLRHYPFYLTSSGKLNAELRIEVTDRSLDWLSGNLQIPSLKTKYYSFIENLAPTLRNMVLDPTTDPILRMLKIEPVEVIRKQVTGAILISTILRNKLLFKLDDDVVLFLRYSMVAAPTSASVERAFSHLNYFKNSGSSRMKVSMENARLRVITNGPSITTYDPAPSTMRFVLRSKPTVDDGRKGGMTAIKQESHLPFSERRVILRPGESDLVYVDSSTSPERKHLMDWYQREEALSFLANRDDSKTDKDSIPEDEIE
ncbi:hypothetical protein B9Z55_021124 [Caenorhabditis nigoni]|nr:hypothetical protein B9Z55_021124 [Caenorhabditis nigoni]